MNYSIDRWKKLAGLKSSEESEAETLNENFRNLGIASPAPMGNPFGGQQLYEAEEPDKGEDRLKDAKHCVRNAMEALQTAIKQGLDEDEEMAKEVEDHLSTAYKKLTASE